AGIDDVLVLATPRRRARHRGAARAVFQLRCVPAQLACVPRLRGERGADDGGDPGPDAAGAAGSLRGRPPDEHAGAGLSHPRSHAADTLRELLRELPRRFRRRTGGRSVKVVTPPASSGRGLRPSPMTPAPKRTILW